MEEASQDAKNSTKKRPTKSLVLDGNHPNQEVTLEIKEQGMSDFFIFSLRFDEEDKYLATEKFGRPLNNGSVKQMPITCLRWKPASRILISGDADGNVTQWYGPSGKQLHSLHSINNGIMCLDVTSDGSKFATAGNEYRIRVYDEETNNVVQNLSEGSELKLGHKNRIFSLMFLKEDPNVLLSGGWDANILIWDLRQSQRVGAIYGPNLSGDGIDFSDGLILTASYRNDTQLQLWDFRTLKLFKDIEWNPSSSSSNVYAYMAQFKKSKIGPKTIAAGSSGLGQLMIYDVNQDYKPSASVSFVPEGVFVLDHAYNSNQIAFGGGSGILYLLTPTDKKYQM